MKNNQVIKIMIIIACCLSLIFNSFSGYIEVEAADDGIELKWVKDNSINKNLETIISDYRYNDEEVLLSWDISRNGDYELVYNLRDNRETRVLFEKNEQSMDVYYTYYRLDGTTKQAITLSEVEQYYEEVDYNTIPVEPVAMDKKVDENGAIEFSIAKNSSYTYSGESFRINETTVRIKWDGDNIYFQTDNIVEGNITPFDITYTAGVDIEETSSLKILRKLEDFEALPTHWTTNNSGELVDETLLTVPNDNEEPGDKPGIKISYKQPKSWNGLTFEYSNDISTDVNASFRLNEFSGIDDNYIEFRVPFVDHTEDAIGIIHDVVTKQNLDDEDNQNIEYTYSQDTKEYTIEIVQDKDDIPDANKNSFLQWSDLAASRMYETQIFLTPQVDDALDGYEVSVYIPERLYAYTYLQYELKRESLESAYLEILPYAGSEETILNYIVYHSKEKSYLDDDEWLTLTQRDTEIGEMIYIPIDPQYDTNYFKVHVKFQDEDDDLSRKSQIILYSQDPDELIPAPVPTISDIDNLKVVPPLSPDDEDPSKISFDLVWEAPDDETLELMFSENETIYYELLINEDPEEDNSDYEVIKLYKLVYEDGYYKLKDAFTDEMVGFHNDSLNYEYGYNELESKFTVQSVIFRDSDNGWATLIDIDSSDLDIEDGEYSFSTTEEEYDGIKDLPNVNFLRMRAISIREGNEDTRQEGAHSSLSVANGLSLSMLEIDVPSADGLQYDNLYVNDDDEPIQFNIEWNVVDISDYEEGMLEPLNKSIDALYYEVYLSDDEETFLSAKVADNEVIFSNDLEPIIVESSYDPINNIEFVDLRDYREGINKGDIIQFDVDGTNVTNGEKYINVRNLYNNQVYYAMIVTRVDYDSPDTVYERSNKSEILSITTNYQPSAPIEEDQSPLAPDKFEVLEEISGSTIKLGWDINIQPITADETIGYELIRVANNPLDEDYDSYTQIESILSRESDATGWRVIKESSGYKLYRYNTTDNDFEELDLDYIDTTSQDIEITDATLSPNVVYYYYLRAVRVEDGLVLDIPASLWSSLTYTTPPINKPVNLKVVYDKEFDYDVKTEVIIQFEAPIPDDEDQESLYVNQVYVYSDDDDYFKSEGQYLLVDCGDPLEVSTENIVDGYKRYYYKISGLNSGTMYSIKVRIEDRTGNLLSNGSYPKSSFSDRVNVRTEYDEDEYDRTNKLNDYMSYFEDEVEKLDKVLAWQIDTEDGKYGLKYREDAMIGEIQSRPTQDYELETNGESHLTYYLPNELIDEINDGNIRLILRHNDLEMIINGNTIEKSKINQLKSFAQSIQNSKEIRDYYIKITVDFMDYTAKINAQQSLSELIRINIEAVGSTDYDFEIENYIKESLDNLVENSKQDLQQNLIEIVNEEIVIEEDLLNAVTEELATIKEELAEKVRFVMETKTNDNEVTLYKLNDPIDINFISGGQLDVQGYMKKGALWSSVETLFYDNSINMETIYTGEYIFAGKGDDEVLSEDIENRDDISGIIQKYKLTQIYTIEEINDPESLSSKDALYQTSARVMGASNDADGLTWLLNNGIYYISRVNLDDNIKKEEAMYILAKVYEYKADIDLDSVIIKNYNAIDDYDQINPLYQSIILQAVSLQLIELDEGYLNPEEYSTVQEILQILNKIENKEW